MEGTKKKIVLCPNPGRDIGMAMTAKVFAMLKEAGAAPVVCPVPDDEAAAANADGNSAANGLEAQLKDADMAITFGGDGTILRAARAAAPYGVPILGINMGGKGFMTELETHEAEKAKNAAAGEFWIESRMMLSVEACRGAETVYDDFALNDVVVKGDNKVIDLTILGDGHKISGFSGDGAIIATPTGSTAYSMAAGGPIVEPAAENIIITPICAHILEAKAFVLASDRRVSVIIGNKKQNPAYLSVDGRGHVEVRGGDTINVCRSGICTRFVRLSEKSFYSKVSEKLGECV